MTKRFILLIALFLALVLAAGCSCGGGDDDSGGAQPPLDDDSGGDDTAADDTGDDDSAGDDTSDDDTQADDTSDDTSDDDTAVTCDWTTHDPLIVEGKTMLSQGNAIDSYNAFASALEICPHSADAEMGILIADAMWYGHWVKTWYDFATGTFWGAKSEESDSKGFAFILQTTLRESFIPVNAEMYRLADDLTANHRDVQFYINPLPMWIDGDHVVLDMSGEWDVADAENLRAFAGVWEFIERLLLAFDIQFDYGSLTTIQPPPGMDLTQTIHFYTGFILQTLADPNYPNFLTLMPDGAGDLRNAGVAGGHMCGDLAQAFADMLLETDPQQDDVAGYVDLDGNGHWDEGEPYKLPYFGDLNSGQNDFWNGLLHMSADLGVAFLDGGPDDLYPLWPNWFDLADLNFLIPFAKLLGLLDPSIVVPPIPSIPVPIGYWFYNPQPDGIRSLVATVAQALYDYTTP